MATDCVAAGCLSPQGDR